MLRTLALFSSTGKVKQSEFWIGNWDQVTYFSSNMGCYSFSQNRILHNPDFSDLKIDAELNHIVFNQASYPVGTVLWFLVKPLLIGPPSP